MHHTLHAVILLEKAAHQKLKLAMRFRATAVDSLRTGSDDTMEVAGVEGTVPLPGSCAL